MVGNQPANTALLEYMVAAGPVVIFRGRRGGGHIDYVSPNVERLLGYTVEEVVGVPHFWSRRVHPHDREQLLADYQVVQPQPAAELEYEYRFQHKDGSYRWLSTTVLIERDSGTEDEHFSGYVQDITARRQSEEALRRKQAELTDFVENSVVSLHWVGADGQILWANQAELDLLGYTREEYINRHIAEFHVDQAVINDILQRLARNESLHDYEARLRSKDGTIKHVLISSNVLWENDTFVRTRCFTRDITQQRHAEEALRRTEEHYRLVVQNVNDVLFMLQFDKSANTIATQFVSDQIELVIGYRPEEFMQDSGLWFRLVHPDDRLSILEAQQRLLDQPQAGSHVYRLRCKHGNEYRWVEDRIVPRVDEDGTILGIFGVLRDITEHKQAEDLLRASEAKYRALTEQIPAVTYVRALDDIGSTLYISPQIEPLVGYSQAEWSADPTIWSRRLHPADRERVLTEYVASCTNGRPFHSEYRVLARDGRVIWCRDAAMLVQAAGGTQLVVQGVLFDITEQKRTEAALRDAKAAAEQANRAKSEFLARASHELRTPLSQILGFGQLLKQADVAPAEAESVAELVNAGWQMLELVDKLLGIAQLESGEIQLPVAPVPLREALLASLTPVQPAARECDVVLQVAMAEMDSCCVQAERQSLVEALVQLLTNAIKYNHDGGSVTLACMPVGDERVRICVQDTGIGIPADKLSQLFTPFDRIGAERTAIQGRGLGLALAQRLVKAMGGAIGVESAVGSGTSFWIDLPLADCVTDRTAAQA